MLFLRLLATGLSMVLQGDPSCFEYFEKAPVTKVLLRFLTAAGLELQWF